MFKIKILPIIALFFIFLCQDYAMAQQPVSKTNPMKVYMHYMPWFETPATIGHWGWHWTMNSRNPELRDEEGQRQIASHYYPLIGPYASRDKDVIEYHLLLMKLSGIDGVLINWYGVQGSNGDINDLLISSDSIVSYTDDFGMEFAVVMEDRFSRSEADVKANLNYLGENYFTRPQYIRYGEEENPLVCIFGPITIEDPQKWIDIMPSASEEIEFLTLWYESGDAGSLADGEFAWVYQDNQSHSVHLDNFYNNRAPSLKIAVGSAYPGFVDYYEEGNAGNGYFTIPHYYGSTFGQTLSKISENKDVIDMVQLVTFNDFGEGTMIEPTVETGFSYLEKVMEYTGVSYTKTELELVHRLYRLRKGYKNDAEVQQQLDEASTLLRNLNIEDAAVILNAIEIISSTKEEDISGRTSLLEIYPNPVSSGTIHLNFRNPVREAGQLQVFEVSGKCIYSVWLETGVSGHTFNTKIIPGIYLVAFQNKTTRKFTRIVVKE